MSLDINTQAIKFLESGEQTFNNTSLCGCNTDEQFSYLWTSGDEICFQIKSTCTESEELVLNGSFEDGESATNITSWARDVTDEENTNVQRLTDATAPCGSYVAKWLNSVTTPSFAQLEQNYTFVTGSTYKITLIAKIESALPEINNILEVIAGGQSYFITPTTEWAEYEIIATFVNAPSTPYLQIKMNEISTNVQAMYVDCVSMVEIEGCCIIDHANNGCFELGQRDGETVAPTFDNWTTQGAESLTGGFDGGRCFVFNSIGDFAEQDNVLLSGKNIVKFWAKSDVDGTFLDITTLASGFVIDSLALTTTWTQYIYEFINSSDDGIKFELTEDEVSYLDCVEIYSIPELNVYIKDSSNDNLIPVNPNTITVTGNSIDVCIPVDDYDMPSCFQICIASCFDNLFLNGDFALGSGNLFTDWTLTQPSRTNLILQSNALNTAQWTKSGGTAPNATTFTESNAAGSHYFFPASNLTVTNAVNYTWWADFKTNGRRYVLVYEGFNDIGAFFDLQTGTVLGNFGAGTLVSKRIIDLGNGYYRCAITYTQSGTTAAPQVYLSNNGTGISYTGDGVSGVLAENFKFELGNFITPHIPTTTLAVTTSTGEFLQDTTGGIGSTRALKMWVDSGSNTTYLRQAFSLVSGTQYNIRLFAKYSEVVSGAELYFRVNGGAWTLISAITSEFEQYEINYTSLATSSQNIDFKYVNTDVYGFALLDAMQLFTVDSEPVEKCSENMKFTDDAGCNKMLVWYDESDSTDVMGIDYTTGFKNKIRVQSDVQNPNYLKTDFVKTLNGDVSQINSIKIKKTIDLAINALPLFLTDRLAGMLGVSNIEYNGVEYCSVEESEITLNGDINSRLYNTTITVSPKGEYVAERSFNC